MITLGSRLPEAENKRILRTGCSHLRNLTSGHLLKELLEQYLTEKQTVIQEVVTYKKWLL